MGKDILHDKMVVRNGVITMPKYHTDWNWLMEVVGKIESLNFVTSIYYLPKSLNTVKILSGGADVVGINRGTKIDAVYMAVVEFIKYYNGR